LRAGFAFPPESAPFSFLTPSLSTETTLPRFIVRTLSDARGRGHRGGFRRPRYARYPE
jgi:hypothetical protein